MTVPEPGQSVLIRSRPAMVRDVQATSGASGADGSLHLVTLEYLDGADNPDGETVVWERELGARVLSLLKLPPVDDRRGNPAKPREFLSLIDALRWSSVADSGLLPSAEDQLCLVSPWHGAVEIADYQLYPVLKAMAMPRVALMLADDVGLGKTIEAALIMSELIARRRIRRVLIICPASLQVQWQEEMRDKFALDFTVIDAKEVFRIQRTLGMDANPWLSTPRVITSMDFLRQADVQEDFRVAAGRLARPEGGSLAWDLLVVDEAHNLTPSTFGDDSQRCQMLRRLSPHFEHRLFLTATPHNGYTVSFTGILEVLDPVRFQQKQSLDDSDDEQITVAVVRRLKSELNARSTVPRFPDRDVTAVPVKFEAAEGRLFSALQEYREQVARRASRMSRREAQLVRFLVSILTKRLLSCSYAFARTWWSHVMGYELDAASYAEAANAASRAQADLDDDAEKAQREEDAVRQGAAWMKDQRSDLAEHARAVSDALIALDWTPDGLADPNPFGDRPCPPDARWDELAAWVQCKLREGQQFRDDERAIIFTEYKDTQDYLLWRLEKAGFKEPHVGFLFGGSGMAEREAVKEAFNDPGSPLRILVATDVASEGLNLQTSCRYVFNQDIPWNPMRLDQRIGRVDRHGQARDVFAYHFTSDEQADLQFLDRVVKKVDQIREDLGSVGQVVEDAVMERFTKQPLDADEMERRADHAREHDSSRKDNQGRDRGSEEDYRKAIQALHAVELRLGLNEQNMYRVMDVAMGKAGGALVPEETDGSDDGPKSYRIRAIPPAWETLINESVRIRKGPTARALPKLAFDPDYFVEDVGGREVFKPRPDARLIRLGHPLMKRALSHLRRRLWADESEKRWTVMGAEFPSGTDAVLVLHALRTATNELRETIREELVSWPFLVEGDALREMDPDYWRELRNNEWFALRAQDIRTWHDRLADLWPEHEELLERWLDDQRQEWETGIRDRLEAEFPEALKDVREAHDARLKEIAAQNTPKGIERRRREMIAAQEAAIQRTFDEEENQRRRDRVRELERELAEAEWERQHNQLQMLKEQLERDRERLLEITLPLRYALARVDVQPVGVEYRVRARRGGGE